eukprot:13464577-Ditylum_brightwellii.AAC.1
MMKQFELENNELEEDPFRRLFNSTSSQVIQPPVVSSYPIFNPDIDIELLNMCEGDCDNDDQCRGDLICKTNPGATIEGCSGTHDSYGYDFCVVDDTPDSAFVGKVILVGPDGNVLQGIDSYGDSLWGKEDAKELTLSTLPREDNKFAYLKLCEWKKKDVMCLTHWSKHGNARDYHTGFENEDMFDDSSTCAESETREYTFETS